MKGVIFNLLEDFIAEHWGAEALDSILTGAADEMLTKEPFVGPGTYPDVDFFTLLNRATAAIGVSVEDACRLFGRWCFPRLISCLPECLEGHATPKTFLLTIHETIHAEVRKLIPDAVTPAFYYQDIGELELLLTYQSTRDLYAFVDGLLEAVGLFFQSPLRFERHRIEYLGQPAWQYHIRFAQVHAL